MADMTPLNDILNGAAADATDVQANFQTIETYINSTNLIRADGTEVMTADLDMDGNKVVNLATPTTSTDAVTKAYVDSFSNFTRTTDEPITATEVYDVVWQTEVVDYDGWGAAASDTLTCPETGLYYMAFVLTGTGTTEGLGVGGENRVQTSIVPSGTYSILTTGVAPTGVDGAPFDESSTVVHISFFVYATTGATFKARITAQGSVVTGSLTEAACYIARLT